MSRPERFHGFGAALPEPEKKTAGDWVSWVFYGSSPGKGLGGASLLDLKEPQVVPGKGCHAF